MPPTRRRIPRRGRSTGLPTKAPRKNHVGTRDFIADATVRGGTLRMLTGLDEHTRECHVLRADRPLKSGDVIKLVQAAITQHGAPEFIRSDNGSEFIAKALQRWLAENQIKTIYIEPGSPWQNGFVESFHGRFRDECLNREQRWTLTEARVVIEDFGSSITTSGPIVSSGTNPPLASRPIYLDPWLRSGTDNQRQSYQPQPITQTEPRGGSKIRIRSTSSRLEVIPTHRPKNVSKRYCQAMHSIRSVARPQTLIG